MATVKEIVEQAYTKVNGEYEILGETSDDFRTYLTVLNRSMRDLFDMPYVKWQMFYDNDFLLPEEVEPSKLEYLIPNIERISIANTPFDSVYFVNGDGNLIHAMKLTDQARFDSINSPDAAMIAGDRLILKTVPDKIVGRKIKLPVYIAPAKYTSGAQTVAIGSVSWLVAYMAASICDSSPVPFIARNAEKYSKQADIFMKGMRANNNNAQHLVIKSPGVAFGQKFGSLSEAINAGVGVQGLDPESIDGGAF